MFPQIPNKYISGMQSYKPFAAKLKLIHWVYIKWSNLVYCLLARDAGTTGAAGASAPLAFCIFNFVGAVRVQTMGVTGAQNFHNRQN
jgi:hypothetical protein